MPIHDTLTPLLALAGVLALIWLIHRLLARTRFARPGEGGRLRVVQSLALYPRRRVVLLECDGRSMLLLVGGGTDQLLECRPAPGAMP